jgi:hypothetical protein
VAKPANVLLATLYGYRPGVIIRGVNCNDQTILYLSGFGLGGDALSFTIPTLTPSMRKWLRLVTVRNGTA